MPKKADMKTMVGIEAASVALSIGAEIVKLILAAFAEGDPKKLKRVTDILPRGHELKSQAALVLEMEIALRGLGRP
jgi:hypothetical protein